MKDVHTQIDLLRLNANTGETAQRSIKQVAEKRLWQAAQKDPEARRAKNRRAEAYIGSTLTRGD
jgi:hypothetical protein